jgi:hypothetical protein
LRSIRRRRKQKVLDVEAMLGGFGFTEGERARAFDVVKVKAFVNKLAPKTPLNGIRITSTTAEAVFSLG